jgi:predicted GNAT superfamily acetyltransferase
MAPTPNADPAAPESHAIRDLTDYADLRRCVTIQERTWGAGFTEIVPPAILWIATRTGGVVAGAFEPGGELVGFVFGISGFREGRPVHWSDMLAVLPEGRGAGLGRSLKLHQRRVLLEGGIRDVYWTFDPLESRNAHINFGRLGAVSGEYIPDCYGTSDSPLHAGLATDRLVVHWRLDAARVASRLAGEDMSRTPSDPDVINPSAHAPRLDLDAEQLLLRIPSDIQAVKRQDPGEALRWRETVREALQHYLDRGYLVVDLVRSPEDGRDLSGYVLARDSAAQAALSR